MFRQNFLSGAVVTNTTTVKGIGLDPLRRTRSLRDGFARRVASLRHRASKRVKDARPYKDSSLPFFFFARGASPPLALASFLRPQRDRPRSRQDRKSRSPTSSLARDQVQFVTNGKSVIGSGMLFIIAGQSCGLAEQDRKPHDRTANDPKAICEISVSSLLAYTIFRRFYRNFYY